jgi:beta-glucosidase/6-phospho-beta-glucosidase/beta-galactosidase
VPSVQEPNSTSSADAVSVQRNYDFALGWFNNGPWNDGDYPQSLKDTLGEVLPTLTQQEKDMIKGSCDFFAIDGYTAYYAFGIPDLEACVSNSSYPGYPECAGSASTDPDGFPIGPSADPAVNWLYDTPIGIRRFLKTITTELFPSVPDIMVTEFGFAEPFESKQPTLNAVLWDLRRSDYYQGYLDNILAAIVYDGVNVTGAWGWAIFDSEPLAVSPHW